MVRRWSTIFFAGLLAGLPAGLIAAVSTASAAADDLNQDAMRFGAIATTAPLCGLRDNEWARDLRSAEVQALARTIPPNDAIATLSYAEDQAIESFAEATPQTTCGPLRRDPDLRRADDIVKNFRKGAKV